MVRRRKMRKGPPPRLASHAPHGQDAPETTEEPPVEEDRKLELWIGNRKYSSWSMRPWIAMRVADVPFTCRVIPFGEGMGTPEYRGTPRIREVSPTGKVPVLHHGGLVVHDSLAILEYVAELFPDRGLWPEDLERRARARAVSAEMHSGFAALRRECGMNMGRPPERKDVSAAALADAARIDRIWSDSLDAYGGPFLFGERFCNADAMFAPVVNRFHAYDLPRSAAAQAYMDAIMALDAWREWEREALAEPWTIPAYETP